MRKQIPVPHNAKAAFSTAFLVLLGLLSMACRALWRALCKQFLLNLLLQPFTTYWVGPFPRWRVCYGDIFFKGRKVHRMSHRSRFFSVTRTGPWLAKRQSVVNSCVQTAL